MKTEIYFNSYSTIQRLPFESCELVSRETTITDLRPHSQDMTHSISEYYLHKRHNQINRKISLEYGEREEYGDNRENSSNDTFCDNTHPLYPESRQKNDQICSNNNYGSCAQTHAMSVEFINQSFITSISDSSFNVKQEPTEQTSSYVAGIHTIVYIFKFFRDYYLIKTLRDFTRNLF